MLLSGIAAAPGQHLAVAGGVANGQSFLAVPPGLFVGGGAADREKRRSLAPSIDQWRGLMIESQRPSKSGGRWHLLWLTLDALARPSQRTSKSEGRWHWAF